VTKTALVLGAREGSGNIGDEVVNKLTGAAWEAIGTDCAVGDGSRPPGGNLPNDEVAREFGYTVTDKGRYQRFEVPSFDWFRNRDADALVVTLGATYKGHFAEIPEWQIDRIMKANLIMPLEAARRFVSVAEEFDLLHTPDSAPGRRKIVFVGSYAHTHPFTNGTLYCAAKAGLNMAARTLGWELTDRGYSVHIVHPYHVQGTPMWEEVEKGVMASKGMSWEEADAYNRKDLKMPDLLTPREVARVIGTLIDSDVMEWTSGSPIELFGGSR
jgi:NAD(P)-dependent dehydrogenase (short-subunit alcohol dehydrogenase family)